MVCSTEQKISVGLDHLKNSSNNQNGNNCTQRSRPNTGIVSHGVWMFTSDTAHDKHERNERFMDATSKKPEFNVLQTMDEIRRWIEPLNKPSFTARLKGMTQWKKT